MKLKLSISTCPNDTFMFDAMLHRRIDTEGLDFDLTMADIEQLNAAALAGEPDITKLSYASFPLVATATRYSAAEARSVAATGHCWSAGTSSTRTNCATHASRSRASTRPQTGCCHCFSPKRPTNGFYLFSDIADAVLSDECDAGVLIHEGRFTTAKSGLRLVADLGEEWENSLAAAAARSHRRIAATGRATGTDGRARTAPQRRIRRANPRHRPASCAAIAQELSEEVTRSHIELFVNDYSVDLGAEGRKAVTGLLGTETFGIKEEEVFV